MKNVQRYERCDSYIMVSGAVVDSDGFMRDSPNVARAGVQIYVNPDGSIRREYRPPDEVFNADSLSSYIGKPITVDHPKAAKVTSKTVRKLAIGTILSGGYRKDDNNVGCDIIIHDPDAIGERRELSLGYRVDLEEVSGVTPDGEHYDAIQHNIRVNHLAVVQSARAGHQARLNLDGNEVIEDKEDTKTMKIKIDSNEYDVDQAVASHISALTAKCDAAEAKAEAEKVKSTTASDELAKAKKEAADKAKELDTVTAERDALQAKVEKAEEDKTKAVNEAVEKTKKQIKERAELEDACKKAKVEKTDSMDNKAMKIAVIKAVRGDSFNEDGKSDSYIDAAYDFAVADLNTAATQKNTSQQLSHFTRNDGKQTYTCDAEESRANMLKSYNKEEGK